VKISVVYAAAVVVTTLSGVVEDAASGAEFTLFSA
jgi:hypothetical protein